MEKHIRVLIGVTKNRIVLPGDTLSW